MKQKRHFEEHKNMKDPNDWFDSIVFGTMCAIAFLVVVLFCVWFADQMGWAMKWQ